MSRVMSCVILGLTVQLFSAHCEAQDSEPNKDGPPALMLIESSINDTYLQVLKTAIGSQPSEQVDSIRDSESKWLAYRNAECKAEKGGDACVIRMTKERITALKALYLKGIR